MHVGFRVWVEGFRGSIRFAEVGAGLMALHVGVDWFSTEANCLRSPAQESALPLFG